ncbi:MAG: YdgA family protein [Pseudomonadales bacterium]
MKKSIGLVIVVAVVLLLLPGWLGGMAERQLREQLALADPYEGLVSIAIANYQRGWFRSEVEYEIGLAPEYVEQLQELVEGTDAAAAGSAAGLQGDEFSRRLHLRSHVGHGPIGFLDGPFFGMFKALTSAGEENPEINEFVQTSGMPYLFEAETITSFFGTTQGAISVPPINADGSNIGAPKSTGAMRFSGLDVKGEFHFGNRAGKMTGGFELLEIVGEEAEMVLEGVRLQADSRAVSKYMWVGPADFDIARFDVRSKGDAPSIVAEALSLQVRSSENSDGETLNIAVTYGAKHLQLPESAVVDAQMGMALENVSVAALDEYYAMTQAVTSMNDEAMSQLGTQAPAMLYQFAQRSPTLALTPLRFTLDGEPFDGSLELTLDGNRLPGADAFSVMDVGMWAQVVSAQGEASVSKALAESMAVSATEAQMRSAFGDDPNIDATQLADMARIQAPMMLNTLVQQGLIKEAQKTYSAQLRYGDGELLVNGQSMPIGALLQ